MPHPTTLLKEFSNLVLSINYIAPTRLSHKGNFFDNTMMDFPNPLQRGQILEEHLIKKIIYLNRHKTVYKLEGRYYNSKKMYRPRSSYHIRPKTKKETY